MTRRIEHAVLLLVLITITPYLLPAPNFIGPSVSTVHAVPRTALGVWSSNYNLSVVVDSSISTGTVVQLRVNASGGGSINGFDITVNWTSTVLNGVDLALEGPAMGVALLNDARLTYNDTNNNNAFNTGETVVYDADNSGTYSTGDTVLSGTAPSIGAALKTDPKVKFVDDNSSNSFNIGEAVVFDADNSGAFNAGDTIIVHSTGIFSAANFLLIRKEVATDHVRLAGVSFSQYVANNTVFFFTVRVLSTDSTRLFIPPHLESPIPANYTSISGGGVNNLPFVNLTGFFSNDPTKSDLVLSSVLVQSEIVTKGDPLSIIVTLKNAGAIPIADVTTTLYANDTIIDSGNIALLGPGMLQSTTFVWSTGAFSAGTYNITATATTSSTDAYPADNRQSLETVRVVIRDLKLDSVTTNFVKVKVNTANSTITATVANIGTIEDLANVTVYANSTRINTIVCRPLCMNSAPGPGTVDPGRMLAFTFFWNTTGLALGQYNITAQVSPVPGESSQSDNTFFYGFVALVSGFEHDLRLTARFPSLIKQGDNASAIFTFTIDNAGNSTEDYVFKLIITNGTSGFYALINQTSGTLARLEKVDLSVQWNTKSFKPGIYHVTANVTVAIDENPFNNEKTGDVALGPNLPLPIASFAFTPSSPQTEMSVFFNASASNDPDGIHYYIWDFGDGTTQTLLTNSTTHTYASSGTFTVTLTVWDKYGAQQSSSKNITVSARPEFPLLLYAAIGAVVAVVVALVFVVRRRRQATAKRQNPPTLPNK